MLDRPLRQALDPVTDRVGRSLARLGVAPYVLTGSGLLVGLGAALAAGVGRWGIALVLWLLSRVFDGLDGPVARASGDATERGGFFDIVADFTVYGAFVVGCAIGNPPARLALLVLLFTYYVNGTAFLAFSSLAERRGRRTGLEDERSLVFTAGLAEGTETIVAHALMVAVPSAMATIAWVFAVLVAITVGQRVWWAARLLRD